jgi:hypothetical protein
MSVSGKTHNNEQLDNHSNQLNSNNHEYWNSRGEEIAEVIR